MSDLSKRIEALSPEKRELLLTRLHEQKRLHEQAGELAQASIRPRNKGSQALPLSFAQEHLWFLHQLAPGSPFYNISEALYLEGPLNLAALEQSLNALLQRHETLRTSFVMIEGCPMQVISPTLHLALSVTDLNAVEASQREEEALRQAHEEARQPFDLTKGPLIRARVLRLNEAEHILVLTLHHIISDAWSMGLLVRELATLYAAWPAGPSASLPELPIQFADVALWEREQLQGDVLENHLSYWKQQLSGMPALLELPTDFPRPSVQSFRGVRCPFVLSQHLSEQLRALSLREGATLFMTLLAAFQTLLSRYTEQGDIVVGSPIANRHRIETQGVIGFLVNMLVLRSSLSDNPSFRELLRRVRKMALEAYTHQDFPFEKLVEALQPERSLSHTPLFQVAFALENTSRPVLEVAGIKLHSVELESGTAKFDLTLFLRDTPDGLAGTIEYNSDLFEERTIRQMAACFQTLLAGIVTDPEQPLSELPLLTEAEQHRLLVEWNATQVEYPKDQCVHQLFEAQAKRAPEAVALVYREEQLTYRELNQRANQLAHQLQKLGVGPEVRVGLCMDRSIEMIVGLLGILKAGGAYVPLDPAYPSERLAFMLQDTQAQVLVTQERLISVLPTQGLHLICLNPEWKAIAGEPAEAPINKVTAANLAYVMYTSGSTGKPKGVEIRHRSIIRLLFGVDYVQLNGAQTVLQLAPISFDAATFEIWGALLYGARCILFPERLPTPKNIGATLQRYNITTLWLTASLFNTVIDEAPGALQGVKQLLTGGEALSVAHIRRALELLSATQLINGYGPTESTTFTCCYSIPRNLSSTIRSIPIGRPIGNTQVYILDRSSHPVPVGVPGELHIGGTGLARGYLNRPELTAEKFIENPFSKEPGELLYKTGDMVRYLADGAIEFLGRYDQQIKLRGFRIELGEIEAVLSLHPTVRDVLVLARENDHSEKYLVAYVVPGQKQEITINTLRDFLRERLPEYMIPAFFVLLDALPLTPNGKLDWRALPAPELSSLSGGGAVGTPTLMAHYQVLQIWEELLEARPIDITDNFFHLGGHSLLAARLLDRIEHVFGQKIALATLFAGPTIDQIAAALERQEERSVSRTRVVTVQAGGSKRPFFFAHGDWNGGAFYCFPLARALGSDQPFYVLEPFNFDGLQVPPTFEEMAAAHITAMRTVQPEGPYLLGGFCNGGLLAYEMARQLKAAGQQVALLLLLDPASPAPYSHRLARSLINHFGALVHLSAEKQLNWFLRLRYVYITLRHTYRYMRIPHYRDKIDLERRSIREGLLPPKQHPLLPTIEFLRQEWGAIYRWVISAYAPAPYAGKITFFWPREDLFHQAGWRNIVQGGANDTHLIPGSHDTCRTEYLPILAEHLSACLSQGQETLSS